MQELRYSDAERLLTDWLRKNKLIDPTEIPRVFKSNIILHGKAKEKAWAMHTRDPAQGIYLVFFKDRSIRDLYKSI